MLITFYLWKEGYIEKPVLFLSSFFKRHQQLYYEKLLGYHHGHVVDWIDFFLDGVVDIAHEAISTVDHITALRDKDLLKIQRLGKRASESATTVLPKLYAQPIVTVNVVQQWTGFSRVGAQSVIDRFITLGILTPKDKGKKYAQSYMYKNYIDIFSDKK